MSDALRVTVERSAPAGWIELLESIAFVRATARYGRLQLADALARFAAPRFVVARIAGALVGGCVLDERRLRLNETSVTGLYRGLLAVDAGSRGRGVGRAVVDAAFAEGDALADRLGAPVLSYGCVDRHNVASRGLLESLGARPIGSLATSLRYRQWPRPRAMLHEHVGSARVAGAPAGALLDVTADGTERLGWTHGGRRGSFIAARSALRFETLGPLADALVRWTVTPFPVARRRFDPTRFRYVSVRALEGGDDAPALPSPVLDTLLTRHGCHFALLIGDPRHPRAAGLGLAGKTASLDVLGRWHGPDAWPADPTCLDVYPVDL